MKIQENVPLAPLTTLAVGGPARYFAPAITEDEVRQAVAFACGCDLPLFVLGGGSNLLVADSGWPGLVLKVAIRETRRSCLGRTPLFDVGAGVVWDEFVFQAVSANCAGIECLSGIPGSVGGTPVQNVGAYGQDVSETIESVRALDLNQDRVVTLSAEECGFGYRSSLFNTASRGRYVILRVSFSLTEGGVPEIKYADLQKHFATSSGPPSLAQVREAVLQTRQSKGMLLVPGDPDSRSAGSFFKNPVLSAAQFCALSDRAQAKGLQIPSYPALDSQRKVPAAWLVEHSGFSKGFKLGHAGISRKHALALINLGGARAEEMVRLKDAIERGVQEEWDIVLEAEPVFVGY